MGEMTITDLIKHGRFIADVLVRCGDECSPHDVVATMADRLEKQDKRIAELERELAAAKERTWRRLRTLLKDCYISDEKGL